MRASCISDENDSSDHASEPEEEEQEKSVQSEGEGENENNEEIDDDAAHTIGAVKLAKNSASPQVHITSTRFNVQTIFLFSLDLKERLSSKKAKITTQGQSTGRSPKSSTPAQAASSTPKTAV